MRWRSRLLFGTLAGMCLLLLAGCGDDIFMEGGEAGQAGLEPTIEELGLRLAPEGLDLDGLSQDGIDQVARGSYLVNGAGGGCGCHTFTVGYLAGGLEFPLFPDSQGFTSVFSRNLTPDPGTGLALTEVEFIEAMRTGKDFTDSTVASPQRLIVMPWHVFRFMSLDDLKAMYAFLTRIPPVSNVIRETFIPFFPFPPVPFPSIVDGDPMADPDNAGRGLDIPQFFSSAANDPNFTNFLIQFDTFVAGLTPYELAKVGRGSYLVNAIGDCNACHTDGDGDGNFDSGLIPMTVDVNTGLYLAGGVNLGPFIGLPQLFSRNLTPDGTTGLLTDPATGLLPTEEKFIQVLQFGADFRRPGGSLRLRPHFPTEFRMTLDDLKAVYAYLQAIPAINNAVVIVP